MSRHREGAAVTAIARTELRAKLRRIRGDTRQLVATIVTTATLPLVALAGGFGPITAFGRALSTPPLPLGRSASRWPASPSRPRISAARAC